MSKQGKERDYKAATVNSTKPHRNSMAWQKSIDSSFVFELIPKVVQREVVRLTHC